MSIISFDLSLNSSGYCVFSSSGKLLEIGTIDTSKIEETPKKLKLMARKANKILKNYKPKVVVFERGFTRFNRATQQIYRAVGLMNYLFYKQEQIYIPSKSVRKLMCGYGNIKKNDFFLYIKKNNPKIKFHNTDEVDAYALGQAYFIQKESGENE